MSLRSPQTKTLLRIGIAGSAFAVLRCFTPVLVILLGVVGMSALTAYLDYVLLPALAAFVGLTIYSLRRKRQEKLLAAHRQSLE